jgi:hypothetical protein
MMIRLIAIAAATMTISTGAAMAETDGYVSPDPPPGRTLATNSAGLSSAPLSTVIMYNPAATV